MIFNSFHFLTLFPFLFLLYYIIPCGWKRTRNIYLLVISYLLYMNFKPAYALILLYVTFVTYIGAKNIDRKEGMKRKGNWLYFLLSLLPLLFFKYYNFINETCFDLMFFLGIRYELPGLNWAVPVGISFFTFQALSYLADVSFRKIKHENDFLTYALYVSFFPSIVSGPINKASSIIPQINSLRPCFDYRKAVSGLKLLLWGMFMKVVVADRIALYVDTVLSNYHAYSGTSCLFASICYSIQIYADFAGYSLMAIGVGKLLGFELAENFRRPYFSISVTEFWKRWHISLSTWLKDYIYIPLGGNRCSKIKNYWNILVVFLVSGIWHGANWTFIVWGILHGVFQMAEKALGVQKKESHGFTKAIRILTTFILITFAWIFFRMPTLNDAVFVIKRITNPMLIGDLYLPSRSITFFILFGISLLLLKDIRDEFFPQKILLMENSSRFIRWCTYLFLLIVILLTGVFDAGQFIYANF